MENVLAKVSNKRLRAGPEISAADADKAVVMGLNAAIVTVRDERPELLIVQRQESPMESEQWDALPFGAFDPQQHRTLEIGLRSWVHEQTHLELGYVEQLYTFGDRGRYLQEDPAARDQAPQVVSVGYLALTRAPKVPAAAPGSVWHSWYMYLPWEDWRDGKPAMIDAVIAPLLRDWAKELEASSKTPGRQLRPIDRARSCFAFDGRNWDEEKALDRYELLHEAGLVLEAIRDQGDDPDAAEIPPLGQPMRYDHRRIVATAMSRLRGKLKYRPIVFELLPSQFSLLAFQRTVESISGIRLHKQNFRRLVEREGLVERTGKFTTRTGGRPAELFRFRREVLQERPAPGVRVGVRVGKPRSY